MRQQARRVRLFLPHVDLLVAFLLHMMLETALL
jgi:hypothetical protein